MLLWILRMGIEFSSGWKHDKLLWFLGFEQIIQAECTRDAGASVDHEQSNAGLEASGQQWLVLLMGIQLGGGLFLHKGVPCSSDVVLTVLHPPSDCSKNSSKSLVCKRDFLIVMLLENLLEWREYSFKVFSESNSCLLWVSLKVVITLVMSSKNIFKRKRLLFS